MNIPHPSPVRSIVAIVLLIVVVGVMVVVFVNANKTQPSPGPQSTQQRTLLVQIRDDALRTVDSVIMGVPHPATTGTQSELYIPADMIVDVRNGRNEVLADLGIRPITDANTIVSAQTNINIQGTWVLDRLAFAGLVDAVGGLRLTIDQPFVARDRFGTITTIIPVGEHVLSGTEAATYALYLGPRTPESNRQARFSQSWQGLLSQLPDNRDTTRAIVGNLGALARSTLPVNDLSDIVADAAEVTQAGRVTSDNLATLPGALGPIPAQWIDPQAATVQVNQLFAESLSTADRVRFYQGDATLEQIQTLQSSVTTAGFVFVWSGPIRPLPPSSSIAIASEDSLQSATRLAELLNIPATAITVDPQATPGAPMTVVYNAPSVPPVPTPSATVTSSS